MTFVLLFNWLVALLLLKCCFCCKCTIGRVVDAVASVVGLLCDRAMIDLVRCVLLIEVAVEEDVVVIAMSLFCCWSLMTLTVKGARRGLFSI